MEILLEGDAETILNQVQHKVYDIRVWFLSFCHPKPGPEPCPETSSGSIEFDLRFRDLSIGSGFIGFSISSLEAI